MHRVDWIVCRWVVNAYGIAAPAFFVGGPTIQRLKLVSHLFLRLFDVDAQTLGLLQKLLTWKNFPNWWDPMDLLRWQIPFQLTIRIAWCLCRLESPQPPGNGYLFSLLQQRMPWEASISKVRWFMSSKRYFEWHHLLKTLNLQLKRKDTIFDLCRRLNWSLRLCPMTAQLGFPSTCQFLACKTWSWHGRGESLQQEMLAACFFCLDSVAGKLCYFCQRHGRELRKLRKLVIPRVCLCVFSRCNDLKKVGFHPSADFHSWHLLARCCFSFSYSWSCW